MEKEEMEEDRLDHAGGGSGSGGDDGPELVPSSSELQDRDRQVPTEVQTSHSSTALSPQAYTVWIRSTEKKLLAATAASAAGKEAAAPPHAHTHTQEELLHNFWAALQAKKDVMLLNARQWSLWCASRLWALRASASASAQPLLDPSSLKEVLDLHSEATGSCNGSALHFSSFLVYVDLLLSLHYTFEGLHPAPPKFWESPDDEDEDENDDEDEGAGLGWRSTGAQDLLQEWTGLQGGPRFLHARHGATGFTVTPGYEQSGLPRIPTRQQLQSGEVIGSEADWDSILGTAAVREAVQEANSRAAFEVNWSHLLWDMWKDFELVHLAHNKRDAAAAEQMKQMFLARLRVPHRTHELTAQQLSSFVSAYLPPHAYESTMTALQKPYGIVKTTWSHLEAGEDTLKATASASLEPSEIAAAHWQAWRAHLGKLAGNRNFDAELVSAAFERCFSYLGPPHSLQSREEEEHVPDQEWESKFRRTRSKMDREKRLPLERAEREEQREAWQKREDLWKMYLSFLVTSKSPASQLLDALERSVRMLPASGALWAAYLRQLARLHRSKSHIDEVFSRGLEGGECAKDDQSRRRDRVEDRSQVVQLLVGRIDAEREWAAITLATEQSIAVEEALVLLPQDSDRFMEVYVCMCAWVWTKSMRCNKAEPGRAKREERRHVA